MNTLKTGSPSAVALIETGDNTFLLEGRPVAENGIQLAHPGSLQFFGGSIEPMDASPSAAIRRELQEELGLMVGEGEIGNPLWEGVYQNSQNRRGERVARHVSLFYLYVVSARDLVLQVSGTKVEIPSTAESVEDHKHKLTPFAYERLLGLLRTRNAMEA